MSITVHACKLPHELPLSLESGWRELEARAIEPCMYLSPDFVLPAARHLDPELEIVAILVEKKLDAGSRIIAAGVFNEALHGRYPRRRIVRSYMSTHTYLSGVLLDKDFSQQGLSELYEAIFEAFPDCDLCEFMCRPASSGVTAVEAAACKSAGIYWQRCGTERRPILDLGEDGQSYLEASFSKATRKGVGRKKRQLDKLGGYSWSLERKVGEQDIETFLRLEDTGWKHEERCSMLSRENEASFFRDMARRFSADGRMRIGAVAIGDRTIASNVNLLSGDLGFAFKLAWDAQYHRYSPGLINEYELILNAKAELPGIRYIDSGAMEGSFMDRLWKESRTLETGFLCRNGMTFMAFCMEHYAKLAIRRLLRPLLSRPKKSMG
jgi:hypothetical protein